MKVTRFLSIMAAALMLSVSFTSCDELEGLFDDDEKGSVDDQAFFPNSYSQRKVAAWYSLTDEKKGGGKTIEAVFLFEDGSFVTTKNNSYPDDRKSERTILAEGDYEMVEGDFTNGVAQVQINGVPDPMTVEIVDGVMRAMGEEFTKQDNKKVPKASEPTGESGENGNGEGGNGQGGDDGIEAFFPNGFSTKDVASWYAKAGKIQEHGYEMQYKTAIFFFGNGQFVATAHTEVEGPEGPIPTKIISIKGRYEWVEGNFETGKLKLIGDDGKVIVVDIAQGKLTGIETENGEVVIYAKQDTNSVPQPSDPTDNYQPGGEGQGGEGQGGEGQGGEGGEVQYNGDPAPYLPAQYAEKTIAAWYMFDNVGNGTVRYECVFLFTDGSLVVTKSKFYNIGDGRGPEYDINATGQYRMSEGGDFENGTASVVTADGMIMEVLIENGILYAMNTEFTKQDNKDAPAPIKK